MSGQAPDPADRLVDSAGRPLAHAKAESDRCPNCGRGPEARRASGGFGKPHTVCVCGYQWKGMPWNG
jgi:hypothetical protein